MDRLGIFPHGRDGRRQVMRTPDEVAAMQRLHGLGWGTRRIAAEVGCNRETVQRYLAAGAWAPCRVPTRPGLLAGHAAWVAERLRRHRGNADVVRQELASELGIMVSLRTVERAVSHLRREFAAEALATVRFETPPGRQYDELVGQSAGKRMRWGPLCQRFAEHGLTDINGRAATPRTARETWFQARRLVTEAKKRKQASDAAQRPGGVYPSRISPDWRPTVVPPRPAATAQPPAMSSRAVVPSGRKSLVDPNDSPRVQAEMAKLDAIFDEADKRRLPR